MKKSVLLRCGILAAALLLFTACAESGTVRLSSVVPTKEESTYYNGYLGVAVTVPEGMYIIDRDKDNFTETPEESEDPDLLNVTLMDDGGYSLDLISIQNRTTSAKGDHAELYVYAELYEDYGSFAEYLSDLEEYLAMDDGGYLYEMVDVGIVSVAGHDFWRFVVDVTIEETGDIYCQEFYVAQVEDFYLTVYIDYWEDSDDSRRDAYLMLESVSVDGESFGVRTQAL